MTDIAEDATIRRDSRRSPRRRWSSGRCRSGTGRRSPATSATPRRRRTRPRPCSCTGRWSSSPGRRGRGASRSTTVLRPLRRHDAARRASSSRRSSCRWSTGRVGATHVRRTRRRGHDLASVTLACAVAARGAGRARVRECRPATAARGRRRAASLADPGASDGARGWPCWTGCSPSRRPSPTSMRAEPRIPARDAPGPRAAGARDARTGASAEAAA